MAKKKAATKSSPDLAALRQACVEGCDRIVHAPRILVNASQRALADIQEQYWANASEAALKELNSYQPRTRVEMIEQQLAEAPGDITAELAASSMRDRASRVALQHSVFPCGLVATSISKDIDALPLLSVTKPTETEPVPAAPTVSTTGTDTPTNSNNTSDETK